MNFLEISRLLNERASKLKLTTARISRESGVSYRTVYSVLHAQGNPSRDTLEKICDVLELDYQQLVSGKLPATVREESPEYGSAAPRQRSVRDTISELANQLGVPEAEISSLVAGLIQRKAAH